ncbi:MAG: Holliday junction resolvase [Candidatus Iainarchaeum archaeon]|uniref:Holliday junction resolvase n=1 Tax=Candidatus Iainarchaeum sp. TaxID=3101447 RepID=A0A497JJ26_9ARCH|nr:MAG: Holliday junction resolvase [Candidatus Diapherotrites archaeon]
MVAKKRYRKGANAERELMRMLAKEGLAVIRAAGSAANAYVSPDIVALSKDFAIAFECKAWDKSYLAIAEEQMKQLKKWASKANADVFIGWKIPNKGWLFLKPNHFRKSGKHYSISRKHAERKSLDLNVILRKQTTLK